MEDLQYHFKLASNDAGKRLDHFIFESIQKDPKSKTIQVTRSQVRQWIVAGWVSLRDRVVKIPTRSLSAGDWIEVRIPNNKLKPKESDQDWASQIQTVYRDESIWVVSKPAGLPTQPTLDPNRPNLYSILKAQVPYIGLHHRLDRDTSGLVLFTLKKEANTGVSDLFKDHRIQKTYLALCELQKSRTKDQPTTWNVKNFLKKKVMPGKINKMVSSHSGGDRAETRFSLVEKFDDVALVQAMPLTGRMHQIRTHLSDCGMPILGDDLYGSRKSAQRIMLHAERLQFDHPLNRKPIDLRAEPPNDMASLIEKYRKTR